MTKIILADDHQVVRQALRLLLETAGDWSVIAETGDGQAALRLVEQHKPDILIADMLMPGLSGLELARAAKRISPATRTIILSMYDAESYVVESMQAGAAGYVLKKSSAQELLAAIRHALAGNLYLSRALNQSLIQAYIERAHAARVEDPYTTLTPREHQVLQLAAQGFSNPRIAETLSLSARTVEMHRNNLMRKLSLKTQTELVKYALKRGLVE